MRARVATAPSDRRARQVRPRLASSPRRRGEVGRLLDGERVGVAAMMMDVVDERDLEAPAQRQQILDGVDAIVVLEHDHATRPR
jgi:hypothetical protein